MTVPYSCPFLTLSDSHLMATGKFSRRITVNRASASDELKAYLINLDYGQKLRHSFTHTKH